ncbi:MAG: FAD-binding oxidoreductase [Roseitalea sp.]|jgi:glycine/D-amino acid oxidase-like deaminating enzyme|nr:FAD-binding oxidoreductase [Roseitalea sp.]MBO6720781.1 FAD-binding oxidoreductase [Roseitalea sp.]MBO6743928.1 FAD-binding oxidoreductase [Roseitalea sp.]
MKAIVIGSGIVGASVAYRLAEAGAQVTIIEERRIGGGTSSVSYAWVNACEKLDSKSYFDLNVMGREAHERLANELGGHDWYPRPGVLQWQDANSEAGGIDRENQLEKYEKLKSWGYPAELIAADQLGSLEPDIDPAFYGNRPIIHYLEDGWCHAVVYAGRVIGAAIDRHDARFVRGKVRAIATDDAKCIGVDLDGGGRIAAHIVVNAAGRWANEFLDDTATVPLAPKAGLVAYTMPAGLRLTRGLRTPELNLRPDGAGRLLLRAGDIDELIDGEAPPEAAQEHADELLARARRLLPDLSDVPLEASRVAIRPKPADSYSAIGPIPGLSGFYATVTHSGVTLGPAIGELVADEILNGTERPELADFRPARFKTAVSA